MKNLRVLLICALCLFPFAGAARLTDQQKADCEKLLQVAEFKDADWIYDECAFNEEGTAWYEWAPVLSQKGYAKGLYQLCRRYPEHEYADLYCKKAADAGSIPALYTLAQKVKMAGENEQYEKDLLDIIARNNIQNKKKLSGIDDLTTRQAYEDLAAFYYELQDEVKTQNVVPYLQIAADTGSVTAASTLAIFLYQMPQSDNQALYEKYLWQAIMGGCPAAEENLGVIAYEVQGRILPQNRKRLMNKHLFSCAATQITPNVAQQNIKKVQDCACEEVLSWDKVQGHKPFLILGLGDGTALLQDTEGMQYSIEATDKVADGYVVEEIRPTAVILRKAAERIILLYRDDANCIELCKNKGKPQQVKGDIPPYRLTFTPEECEKIAQSVENLSNPLDPFRGVRECQIQDWKKWGNTALKRKRNKHLFLMANYEKSQYIPAYVARAEMMFAQGGQKAYSQIAQTLKGALQSPPQDALSVDKQEYAFCLEASLYLKGELNNKTEGFQWAEQGAVKGYPQSMNILGVAYANGFGVDKDLTKAQEWLAAAETASKAPFADARRNYLLLQSGKDFDKMQYGNCEQITNPQPVSKQELLELYQ